MVANSSLLLRPAHTSEARTIATMSRLQIGHGLNWRWTPSKFKQQIRDDDTVVIVATLNGVIAGFAVMDFGADSGHLLLLAVEPEYRRDGIGTALVRDLEAACRAARKCAVRLEVRSENHIGVRFYEALGYRRSAEVPAYYDRDEAAIVMLRSLAPA